MVDQFLSPQSLSPDGTRLAYLSVTLEAGRGVGIISLDSDQQPQIVLDSDFTEDGPVISPDGRFIAYSSTESGQSEVYVSPFPDVEQDRWLVSRAGGFFPAWSADGSELFYLHDRAMMSAGLDPRTARPTSAPVTLFDGDYVTVGAFGRPYDVMADGQTFLMMSRESGTRPEELTFVQNWVEELQARVPTGASR